MKILRAAGIHPWQNTDQWEYMVRKMQPEVVSLYGFRIQGNWEEDLGILLTRTYEPHVCRIIRAAIRPGDVVLDVGANIGIISLLCAVCAGADGHVYAYEPVAETGGRFQNNLSLNENLIKAPIELRKKGLSNRSGTATIFVPKTVSGKGLEIGQSTIVSNRARTDRNMTVLEIDLSCLDEEDCGDQIDLVKCDIEGAEKLFLEGGSSTLARQKPILILECNAGPDTYSESELRDRIRSFGAYEFFDIGWKGLEKSPDKRRNTSGTNMLCAIRQFHADRLSSLIADWK